MPNINFKDDIELVHSCIKGDHDAWTFFINKYSPLMLNAMGNRLRKYGIRAKAEELKEIRQGLLSSLWEGGRLAEVIEPASLRYWLAIVSGNAAIDYVRKRRRFEKIELLMSYHDLDLIPRIEPSSQTELTPFAKIAKEEAAERIDAAMESLPAKERLVIKLNILHGKKYEEIADILKMRPGSVSVYIKRARERLKKILKNL